MQIDKAVKEHGLVQVSQSRKGLGREKDCEIFHELYLVCNRTPAHLSTALFRVFLKKKGNRNAAKWNRREKISKITPKWQADPPALAHPTHAIIYARRKRTSRLKK